MTIHFQHDLDDDHSGLVAWVDGRGQFFAVGEDDVAREYGDGDEERLRADLQPAAPSPVARPVALMRQQWRTAMNEYLEAEYSDISHLPEHEQEKAFDRAGLESVWKIRGERFGVGDSRPWRRGSWPARRRCASRNHGPIGAIGSSSQRSARRPIAGAGP